MALGAFTAGAYSSVYNSVDGTGQTERGYDYKDFLDTLNLT
jgi:hypothetical protein